MTTTLISAYNEYEIDGILNMTLLKENVSEAANSISSIDVLANTQGGAGTGTGTGTSTNEASNTENTLNNQKDKLNKNLKKIEINSYYSKTYDSQRILLKSVFIYLAIILVLLYLGKFFPVIHQVFINSLIASSVKNFPIGPFPINLLFTFSNKI